MVVLETRDLTRRFDALVAVDHLNIRVDTGRVFGLLGSNGAGKTTVIKMLTTLLPPSSGTATVVGFDIRTQAAKVRRVIGYVPQMVSADGTLTGYENLLIFAKLYDIPRRDRDGRIADALALMELTDAADKLVRDYSGGMIRRLEIAQSMLHRPPVLFLDEPTVGLDPIARNSVWERVRRLTHDFDTTIVLTTHLMEEADALCDTIAILHRGRVAVSGSPAELKASVQKPGATLDTVFVRYAGGAVESGGSYRDVSRDRRTALRVG
ncbi:MAG TPA: ATP-binding cassette domain-containing protein [Vicinamibacterales bacterium]|nr:ATP-binding cassette domain-containing protein [Vicinamibacterales bacterium]